MRIHMRCDFRQESKCLWNRVLPVLLSLALVLALVIPSTPSHAHLQPQQSVAECPAMVACDMMHKGDSTQKAHPLCNPGSACFAAFGAAEGFVVAPRARMTAEGPARSVVLPTRNVAPPLPPPITHSIA